MRRRAVQRRRKRLSLLLLCAHFASLAGGQSEVCTAVIDWCKASTRTFLRQRVEAKLSSVLFKQSKFGPALSLINELLAELKKLDDKVRPPSEARAWTGGCGSVMIYQTSRGAAI